MLSSFLLTSERRAPFTTAGFDDCASRGSGQAHRLSPACPLWANTGSRWNLFDRLPEPARRLMLASALFVACAEQSSSASELGWQWRRHAGLRSANQLASRTLGELFANPDGRISPHAPISIPYRFSAGPIAIGRRGHHVYRRRCVVAWAGDRRSDNSPCG